MHLLLGSALIVLSQHVTAIVPTKRQKVAPKNPVKTLDDKQCKKEFRFAKKDIARLLACEQLLFLILQNNSRGLQEFHVRKLLAISKSTYANISQSHRFTSKSHVQFLIS